jgi:hypothetical protein
MFRPLPLLALLGGLALAAPAFAATATIDEGSKVLAKGDAAEFRIHSEADQASDLKASCDVSAGGEASVTFDGEHFVPLSDPAVGDVISLSAGETKHYDIAGTVEKNRGDAYIAFVFTDVPTAMCFPGMQCGGAAAGAKDVKVACRNAK